MSKLADGDINMNPQFIVLCLYDVLEFFLQFACHFTVLDTDLFANVLHFIDLIKKDSNSSFKIIILVIGIEFFVCIGDKV